MIDDFESKVMQRDKGNSSSDKYYLAEIDLNEEQRKENIIAMSSSKKNIFFLTESHNLFVVDGPSLKPINETYTLPEPKEKNEYKEIYNKIWSDREGNHCIIRHKNAIYYFNSTLKEAVELEQFSKKEICAVALDDRNLEIKTTKNFLAADYNNTLYECCIEIVEEKKSKKIKIKDRIEELTILNMDDASLEEENESAESKKKIKPVNDRIYGIKFFHAIRSNVDQSENNCYIIAVTKNRLYQFIGPGLKTFKQIIGRYDRNAPLLIESCKHFPKTNKEFKVEFDILYKFDSVKKVDILFQFGWRTDCGYCYSNFEYDKNYNGDLPSNLQNFTILPFQKISKEGKKIVKDLNPNSIIHTQNHIFFLYNDCLTVVSKLTSNIIFTKYFNRKFEQMIYHEFSQDNGAIIITSGNGLYKISLKNENKDIWKDYLQLGDYKTALVNCPSEEIQQKIRRINAEEEFNKNKEINRKEAAEIYANSDEKFEVICLKYLMDQDTEGLIYYLNCYKKINFKKKENEDKDKDKDNIDNKLQLNLINTWLIELNLNKKEKKDEKDDKDKKDEDIKDFRALVRENKKLLCPELIYQILLNYGKTREYLTFASICSDFERAVLYNINQGQVQNAIEMMNEFASFDDQAILKVLMNIFLENSHLFFQEDPSDSIGLLDTFFKNNIEVDENAIENVIQALMSRTDKDNIKAKNKANMEQKEKDKHDKNVKAISDYLKRLMEHSNQNKFIREKVKEQMNNIHNLYIYYLSINPSNKYIVIEYLKKYLELDQRGKRKQKVLFQLDYAKRLLKDNKLAYALVLALMGKYSEGVSYALKRLPKENEDIQKNQEIAEYIANSATDKKMRKKLWIEIFRNYSDMGGDIQDLKKEEKFSQAIEIMEKSNILKIEDVLPHITDSVKIEEFKEQITKCIKQYEDNIRGLKLNITKYNETAEKIKSDINKIKKKSTELKYNEFKCEICKGYIKNKNIFLFPCGHMFDMDCIRECLLNYEITGLDYLHDDNVLIDKISYDLGYIEKRVFVEIDKESRMEEQKKAENRKLLGLIKMGKQDNKKDEIQMLDQEGKKELREVLNSCLSKQCVLCGDFLVDSVQCSLNRKKKITDSFGLKLRLPVEPDFIF